MRRVQLAALAATAVLAACPAAASVLDQASVPESGIYYWGSYNSASQIVQTFTVGKSGVLDRIEVALFSYGGSPADDIILELFAAPLDLNAPFPAALASASASRNSLPTEQTFSLSELTAFDVSAANLTVAVGEVYAFSVRGRSKGTNPAGAAYSGGQGFYSNSEGGFNESGDFGFRTYVTSAAPEPGTWALMIGGFGLAGVALRRRNALTA